MIVKSCHIDGFGNLRDTAFEFADGLNVLTENNGWGKSTLAAFIKSMFYGMEVSRRKKPLPEYKRYEPWNGGRYGGSLTFETRGKTYRVIRYFGKKDAVFELYDAVTNLPSGDYSERLGEELFGIDRDSFERSIYIKLDTEKRDPALLGSISAKLNDLVDNTDDINNFETAYKRLDALAASLVSKRGSGGETGRLEGEISEIRGELFACERAQREAERLTGEAKRTNDAIGAAQSELDCIRAEAERLEVFERKKHYDRLRERAEECRHRFNEAEEFFANGLPSAGELDRRINEAKQLEVYDSRMAELPDAEERRAELEAAERFFGGEPPTEAEIEGCRESLIGYGSARERLARYELTDEENALLEASRKSYKTIPTQEEISGYADLYAMSVDLGSQISEKREEYRLRTDESAAGSKNRSMIIGAAAAAAITMAAVAVMQRGTPRMVFASLAAAAAAVAVILLITGRSKADGADVLLTEIQSMQAEQKRLMQSCVNGILSIMPDADISSPLRALEQIRSEAAEIRAAERKRERYEAEKQSGEAEEYLREISGFLSRYDLKENEPSRALSELQGRVNERNRLSADIGAYDRAKAAYDKTAAELSAFLERYPSRGDSPFERVQNVRDTAAEYRDALSDLKAAEAEKAEFESGNDVSAFEGVRSPERSRAEIEAAAAAKRDELDSLNAKKARIAHEMKVQTEIADRRQELEAEAETKQARIDHIRERHAMITETMSLLAKAKEDIDARYMKDMVPAFNKYISMIEPGQDKIVLTAELDSRIMNGGTPKESGYHSRGYADMTNICTRLALYDVMYKGEKPFIVMDDPFVNMDDDKTRLALEFLKKLAEDRQIFYFTCHSSRSVG